MSKHIKMMKTLVVFAVVIGCMLAFPSSKMNLYGGRYVCILGGTIAKEGQFPYQAFLVAKDGGICGAAILSEKWVITAAECAATPSPSRITILVGTIKPYEGGDRYQVADIVIHPEWDGQKHDIALMKTASNIVIGEKVRAIPLGKGIVGGGVDVVYTGFRINNRPRDILSFISLKTISYSACESLSKPKTIYENQICTVAKEGEDACLCDYGTPLAANGELVGILTGKLCRLLDPRVYTGISSYLDWIENNTK